MESFWEKISSWYKNIGEKVKSLAKWTFIVEACGFIVGGFVLVIMGFSNEEWSHYAREYVTSVDVGMVVGGLCGMILGPLVAFVSSWSLYAFGHLVQTTEDNYNLNARQKLSISKKSEAQMKADNERLKKIESLRSAGMITEEEYIAAVSNENGGGNL